MNSIHLTTWSEIVLKPSSSEYYCLNGVLAIQAEVRNLGPSLIFQITIDYKNIDLIHYKIPACKNPEEAFMPFPRFMKN